MNHDQIDQLRASLRREARDIEPVALGVETVQRRGRRRQHRGRVVVAAGAATCIAGVGVAVTQRGPSSHRIAVAAQAGSTAPTLTFRTVNGTVAFAAAHFTTASGVTYELSTAPGVATDPNNPEQAIYRTSDGEHWSTAAQGAQPISDLAERDGVLYSVGTAPGATDLNHVTYRLGTSHNDGADWTEADLPFDETAPTANVALTRSSAVQVARGSSTTVALLTTQFSPVLTTLVAERVPGHPNASTRPTANGYDIVDFSACKTIKQAVAAGDPKAAARDSECSDPKVLGTISWSELGLHGSGDLVRQQILLSTDGSHWSSVAGPSSGYVRDLVATADGFLLLDENYDPASNSGRENTTVYRSSDARTWTAVAAPAGVSIQGIAGDRIIGVDQPTGTVQTSTDGGTTWNATNVQSQLPAGTPHTSVWVADAGPLGFATVASVDAKDQDGPMGKSYLLFSTDGVSWKTSDLDASGAPANAAPFQVTVGADHIGVDYQSDGATPGGVMKITTVLGTPQR